MSKKKRKLEEIEENDFTNYDLNDNGYTRMHNFALGGRLELMKILVEKNDKSILQVVDNNGLTLGHYAAVNGHLDILDYLFKEQKLDIYVKDKFGQTIAHRPSRAGEVKVIKYLVDVFGFNVYTPDNKGLNIIDYSCLSNNSELHEYLKTPKEDMEIIDCWNKLQIKIGCNDEVFSKIINFADKADHDTTVIGKEAEISLEENN
jgi:ankyrin repeat protein